MAVNDDIDYATADLILSRPRRHYSTSICATHWQLRSLLSAERQDTLYYPAGKDNKDIHRLRTTTRETEIIRRLPFQPNCLVAQHGWICCGGEFGDFAAIRIDNDKADPSEADSPFNLDPRLRLLDIESSRASPSVGRASSVSLAQDNKDVLVKSHRFGKERVNCITLWFPSTLIRQAQGAYDQPVAALASNDRTVILVSLRDQKELEVIHYPDCVNRAVISPDGALLVGICDDPYLYVHERVEKRAVGFGSLRDQAVYEWQPSGCKHQLKSQYVGDTTQERGSFAACFSSSGNYLAVGTQYGSISIFDANLLAQQEENPLRIHFNSTRPGAAHGAVRDMAFAPGPVGLLAWTEERGRAGVADVRTGFTSKQILYLDKPEDYEHLSTTNRSSIDSRGLALHGRRIDSSPSSGTDLARRADVRELLDRFQNPLTSDETRVLEALQEYRRRRDQRTATPTTAVPIRRTTWVERNSGASWAALDNPPRVQLDHTVDNLLATHEATVNRAVNEIMGNMRDEWDRQDRTGSSREDSETERRRLMGLPRRASGPTAFTSTTSDRRIPAARPGTNLGSGPGAWGDLQALYHITVDQNAHLYDDPRPTDIETARDTTDAERRWELSDVLMREWEDSTISSRRQPLRMFAHRDTSHRPDPCDSSGLSWSEDGQILYIGASCGVFEFHVNVLGRKLLPNVTLR